MAESNFEELFGEISRYLNNPDGDRFQPAEAGIPMPDLGRQYSDWTVEDSGPRAVVRSSFAQLRLELEKADQMLKLNWETKVPDYLKPGQGVDKYFDKCHPWIFYQLPLQLKLALATKKETTDYHEANMDLRLEYRNGKSELSRYCNDRGRARFHIGFLAQESVNNVGKLTLEVREPMHKFKLSLAYRPGAETGIFGLSIPTQQDDIKAWSPEIAKWILETHIASQNLGGNIDSPANQLSKLLKERAASPII